MRSRTPLALMELTVMLAAFALTAALCLRAFVWSDLHSRENAARDQAVLRAESAVETLKGLRGDYAAAADRMGGAWNGTLWEICYDTDWQIAEDGSACYRLQAEPEDAQPGLGRAEIRVLTADGKELAALPGAWQEVLNGV